MIGECKNKSQKSEDVGHNLINWNFLRILGLMRSGKKKMEFSDDYADLQIGVIFNGNYCALRQFEKCNFVGHKFKIESKYHFIFTGFLFIVFFECPLLIDICGVTDFH